MYDYKDLNELLTKVSDVTVIDLMDKVSYITDFSELMLPLAKGYYNRVNNELVFSADVEYSTIMKDGTKKQLITMRDFQTCTGIIYSEAIGFIQKPTPQNVMIRKNICEKPVFDLRLLSVVEKIIDDYLYRLCPHTHTTANNLDLDKLLRQDVKEEKREIAIGNLETDLIAVIDEVSSFVGPDSWHFYFTKRRGTAIVISKTVDFRIYDWYRMKWEREQPDTDESSMLAICQAFADFKKS